jgi:arylsulfatase A-like enzyme
MHSIPVTIKKRLLSGWMISLWALFVFPLLAAAAPNIVLVMTDDQGYGDLGCHGNSMIRTPHLDRLHSQSVRFTDFHVDPTCSPTRAALLTGRYSTRAGVWHTIMGRSLLFHDELTLSEVLAANGYRNGIFGKWHLGDNYPMRPQDRGFHEVLVHGGGGIGQTPDFWGNDYFDDTYWRNGRPEKQKGYCTDVFFDAALRFIEENKDRPFFVYLPTNVPHSPFHVDGRYAEPYREHGVPGTMAQFYGMIENLDENVGRLRARLSQWGLERNTLFIFMTDNGTAAGVTPRPASGAPGAESEAPKQRPSWLGFNAGMRGQKGSEYDGGHRVPFFVHWPGGGLTGGRDVSQLAAHLDLLPTLVELCDLKFEPKNPLDGRSLVPLLRGDAKHWPDRTLFVHVQREEIPPKWKRSSVMTGRWRLVNGAELHDIKSDPGQQTNVAKLHPAVVEQLRADYEQWWKGLEPRFEEYGWIVIGSDQENPALITCHDWHADIKNVPWHHGQVKSLPQANGYWMIEVARAGEYEFTLRHQPASAPLPLRASRARLKIGDREVEDSVPEGADAATLRLTLAPGRYRMETWLESGTDSRGAFFVEARRGSM